MPTLSVLHNYVFTDAGLAAALPRMGPWELIRSSGMTGETKPYYVCWRARSTKVMVDWPQTDLQQFSSLWSGMRLVSLELSVQEYDEILSAIQSKSVTKTPEVVSDR